MQTSRELSKDRKQALSFQEKRAAQLWAEGVDVDGEPVVGNSNIAKRCGMTDSEFYRLRKTPAFQDEVDKRLGRLKLESARELLKSVPAAVRRLAAIIEHGEDRDASQAALKLLSMAGFSEHHTVDIRDTDATGVVRGGFGRELTEQEMQDIIDVSDEDEDDVIPC